jgi:hypothetical protein
VTADSSGQPLVSGEQSRIECFRKGNIGSIIRREITSQGPNARQKQVMGIAADGEIGEIGKRGSAALLINFTISGVAAENLRHFDIEEVRRVQGLPRPAEEARFYRLRRRRAKKDFQQR